MVKPNCNGVVALFRYADDAVICCQYDSDAQRIRQVLTHRLEKFKLQLNEEKTKLVKFNKRLAIKGVTQETFDFLGFTFYWGKSMKGSTIPKMKTKAKTMKAKLNKVTSWIKQVKDIFPLRKIWNIFQAKLMGHIQYYGVSHNSRQMMSFIYQAKRIVFKWLNRRSQRKSFTWEKFSLYVKANPLPEMRIVHRFF